MQLTVSPRFQGIEGMAQGGHLAGLVSELLPAPVTASFRAPCPIDTPLDLLVEGDQARLSHGPTLILEAMTDARPAERPPAVVSWEAAETARLRAEREPLAQAIGRCFSCGTGPHSLRVHAGRVDASTLFASPLSFPEWMAREGAVQVRFLWAPLDCAAGWRVSVGSANARPAVTGRLRVHLHDTVAPGEPLVVVADADAEWAGRKRHARSAIRRPDGSLVASAESLWIAVG